MRDEATAAPTTGEDEDELERGRPFQALYEHWERHQWSPLEIDLSTDAESFAALDEESKHGFVWIFAHRFHAEFKVATLLAPFLEHAPDWDMQRLIATQIADEHRHLYSVLRVYDEVFGVEGFQEVQELADQNMDPIASACYGLLDEQVLELTQTGTYENYLKAVIAYHVIGEGVVARTAQNLGSYERFGSFPGLSHGRKCVARDEARHIGIGVQFTRRCLAEDRERAEKVVNYVIEGFGEFASDLYEKALAGQMDGRVMAGYGVESDGFYAEIMRLWQLRMRTIGFFDD